MRVMIIVLCLKVPADLVDPHCWMPLYGLGTEIVPHRISSVLGASIADAYYTLYVVLLSILSLLSIFTNASSYPTHLEALVIPSAARNLVVSHHQNASLVLSIVGRRSRGDAKISA